jgi:hypothetical protein
MRSVVYPWSPSHSLPALSSISAARKNQFGLVNHQGGYYLWWMGSGSRIFLPCMRSVVYPWSPSNSLLAPSSISAARKNQFGLVNHQGGYYLWWMGSGSRIAWLNVGIVDDYRIVIVCHLFFVLCIVYLSLPLPKFGESNAQAWTNEIPTVAHPVPV